MPGGLGSRVAKESGMHHSTNWLGHNPHFTIGVGASSTESVDCHIECTNCTWKGKESELKEAEYASGLRCPKCRKELK